MKIACLLDDGFEDSEFKDPYDSFRKAGHEVIVIGLEAGKELKGAHGKVSTKSEKGLDEVSPSEYQALFIPGGYSPDHLRADQRAVSFAKAFMDSDRPVLAICHGPQLLLSADSLAGRRLTAWKTIQGDLRMAGIDAVDEATVTDRNLVTARQPSDIPSFVEASLALIG